MEFYCNEQVAGFKSASFFLLSETSNWPDVVTDGNAGQVIFTPETVDVDGTVLPESITVTDVPKDDADGKTWPVNIGFTYAYRGPGMEQVLEQYAGKPGVTVLCLNDGRQKLFGTDKEPLYLGWNNAYGSKLEDVNGVNINITGTLSQRPVFYSPE